MDSLVTHWRRLEGRVHPDDEPLFSSAEHSFNLDFPPPAYVGDILHAPVVLLELNGGYDPVVTPSEFPDRASVARYLQRLHDPAPVDPDAIAPYYAQRNYAHLIATGRLALVNAVPYRSSSISREPQNRRLAERLPTTRLHRQWLRQTLLPQVQRGERLVVAHRRSLWHFKASEGPLPGVIFTTNPVSADLSRQVLEQVEAF